MKIQYAAFKHEFTLPLGESGSKARRGQSARPEILTLFLREDPPRSFLATLPTDFFALKGEVKKVVSQWFGKFGNKLVFAKPPNAYTRRPSEC